MDFGERSTLGKLANGSLDGLEFLVRYLLGHGRYCRNSDLRAMKSHFCVAFNRNAPTGLPPLEPDATSNRANFRKIERFVARGIALSESVVGSNANEKPIRPGALPAVVAVRADYPPEQSAGALHGAQLQHGQPRITVAREDLRIEWRTEALGRMLGAADASGHASKSADTQVWTVPVALKRCGIETKLVIPNGPPPPAHTASASALRDAVEKALAWNQALLSDPTTSTYALAKTEGVTQRFIAQRLQLAWLAPDILQRIITGDIPDSLTLEQFKNRRIPLDWAEQRAFFRLNWQAS